jgi:hypothetical protein
LSACCAATRIAVITPIIAQNSVVRNDALVSSRRVTLGRDASMRRSSVVMSRVAIWCSLLVVSHLSAQRGSWVTGRVCALRLRPMWIRSQKGRRVQVRSGSTGGLTNDFGNVVPRVADRRSADDEPPERQGKPVAACKSATISGQPKPWLRPRRRSRPSSPLLRRHAAELDRAQDNVPSHEH